MRSEDRTVSDSTQQLMNHLQGRHHERDAIDAILKTIKSEDSKMGELNHALAALLNYYASDLYEKEDDTKRLQEAMSDETDLIDEAPEKDTQSQKSVEQNSESELDDIFRNLDLGNDAINADLKPKLFRWLFHGKDAAQRKLKK